MSTLPESMLQQIEDEAKSAWTNVHTVLSATLMHVETIAKSSAWLSAAWLAFKAAKAILLG